jgi:hypothetical protein
MIVAGVLCAVVAVGMLKVRLEPKKSTSSSSVESATPAPLAAQNGAVAAKQPQRDEPPTSEKRRLGKRELEVVLRDVEDMAKELEEILAELQNGKPVTAETLERIKSWKYKAGSERKLMEGVEAPMFTASQHFVLALNHMSNAWDRFERAIKENGSWRKDNAMLHASSLKLMRDSIAEGKAHMAAGKY